MFGEKPGYLRVTRTRVSTGKLIDEWVFESPLNTRDRMGTVPELRVGVSLKSTDKGIIFCAHGPALQKKIEDTDIERLRQAVDDELRFQHDSLTGLAWEDWLEVQVTFPYGSESSLSSAVWVKAEPIKRAIDPATGTPLTLNFNNLVMAFPTPKQAGVADPDNGGRFSTRERETNATYSYIPATPENVRALEDLVRRVVELRETLCAFMSQDRIPETLQRAVSSANLLRDLSSL